MIGYMQPNQRMQRRIRSRRAGLAKPKHLALPPHPMPPFVAIDFETADEQRDSACAVALVRVEEERIVRRAYRLIRPPRQQFVFSYLHGISWPQVAHEPDFRGVWPDLQPLLDGAGLLVAHNSGFDAAVLRRCCLQAGLLPPVLPYLCTVKLARRVWGIYPTRLNHVCAALGIPLDHHQALSDAEASARIVIAALRRLRAEEA